MYLYGPIQVNYHPARFSSHKHCASGDIIVLVCHVILQDIVIKHGDQNNWGNEDKIAFDYHVISPERVIEASCD